MPARNGDWNAVGSAAATAPQRAASKNALKVSLTSRPSAGLGKEAWGRISVPGSSFQNTVSGSGLSNDRHNALQAGCIPFRALLLAEVERAVVASGVT